MGYIDNTEIKTKPLYQGLMGAATVARLHANPVFLADLAVAKKEVTH